MPLPRVGCIGRFSSYLLFDDLRHAACRAGRDRGRVYLYETVTPRSGARLWPAGSCGIRPRTHSKRLTHVNVETRARTRASRGLYIRMRSPQTGRGRHSRGRARRGDSTRTGLAPSGGARAARPSTYGEGGRDPRQRRGRRRGGGGCERGGLCKLREWRARMCERTRGRACGGSACVRDSHRRRRAERASRPSCSAPVDRCAACVEGVGWCSIDFARAPASRECCQPAIARGTALRDGEEARARPGTPFIHHLPAGARGARRRQNTPCNARSRTASAWVGAPAWGVARCMPVGACVRARSRPRGPDEPEP